VRAHERSASSPKMCRSSSTLRPKWLKRVWQASITFGRLPGGENEILLAKCKPEAALSLAYDTASGSGA
jgi:hypothetical protein